MAILAGLVVGALIAPIAGYFLKSFLPVPDGFHLYPGALGIAALFGLLTTVAFSILPLGRCPDDQGDRTVPVAIL